MSTTDSSSITSPNLENIRLGYQTSIELITHEGQLVWAGATAFAPLLVILLAGAVLEKLPFVQDVKMMVLINLLSACIGVAASYVWWSASARSRRIHKYWIACARDYEASLDGVKTLSQGQGLVKKGEEGAVKAGGETHVLKFPERHSHTTSFNFLYILCFVVFALLVLTHFGRLAQQFR
jgi:hypothetical protein